MSAKSYEIGVFFGRHKLIVATVVIVLAGNAMWPGLIAAPTNVGASLEAGSPSDVLKKSTLAGTKVPDPCETGAEERFANAKALMKAANPDAAFDLLHPCRNTLSAEARSLYGQALINSNAKREKTADAEAKRIWAEKKRNGVYIGMSEQDVPGQQMGQAPEK